MAAQDFFRFRVSTKHSRCHIVTHMTLFCSESAGIDVFPSLFSVQTTLPRRHRRGARRCPTRRRSARESNSVRTSWYRAFSLYPCATLTIFYALDPAAAYKLTSNMIPLLARHISPTSHPLLALSRLHLSLLISKLAEAVLESSSRRLPQSQVDEVCLAASRALSAVSAVFPEGHPVRGIALAELGRLLCVDVQEDAKEMETIANGAAQSAGVLDIAPFPAGAERLKLARTTLLRARDELRRGFGGEGGEVGRQVEESVRNIEKEWKGWRQVVAQGGTLSP